MNSLTYSQEQGFRTSFLNQADKTNGSLYALTGGV